MTENTRTVEIQEGAGAWGAFPWDALKKGDRFRLRGDTGELADKGEVCVAAGASKRYKNLWCVECAPVEVEK